jgi:hypothetical protein
LARRFINPVDDPDAVLCWGNEEGCGKCLKAEQQQSD